MEDETGDISMEYGNPHNLNAVSRVNVGGNPSSTYQYDGNGNRIYDGKRDMEIGYNYSLPELVKVKVN